MESVLKSLFKRELKAILAPYSDIICALFIIAIIGYIIYYLYNKFNENKTKNNVNSIVNNSLKCPNYGLEISPEDRFCLKCGTALTPQTVNPSPSKKPFRYITSNSKIYYYICSRWFCDFIYFTYSHWCYGRINIYLT